MFDTIFMFSLNLEPTARTIRTMEGLEHANIAQQRDHKKGNFKMNRVRKKKSFVGIELIE